jgi:hypothetical protein
LAVPVTGTLVTYAGGVYPVIDPVYGVDGWRSVVNSTVRLAIGGTTPLRMRQGMLVWEQATNTLWQATPSPWNGTNSDWSAVSWNTNGGGGSGTVNNGTTNQLAYYPSNGSTVNGEGISAFLDATLGNSLGATLYRGASVWTVLTGNITTTKSFLTQTGAGASSNAPVWGTIAITDFPAINANTILANNTGNSAAPAAVTTNLQVDSHQGVITVDTEASNAVTVNLATSDWHQVVLNANITSFTLSNPKVGQQFTLIFQQAASGGPYSVTTWFTGTINWMGYPFTAPSMPATASAYLVVTFKCISSGVYLAFPLPASAV